MKEMDQIIKRIKERRESLGFSYQDLANRTGLSKSTLQRYETGAIGSIPLDRLEGLANALQLSPSFLMGWEEDRKLDFSDLQCDLAEDEVWIEEFEDNPEMAIVTFEGEKYITPLYLMIDFVKDNFGEHIDKEFRSMLRVAIHSWKKIDDRVTILSESPTTIAAHALNDLTDEQIGEVMNFIDYLKSKKKK